MKKYYITTPLYYVNAAPHIGHAYTTVAADILARYKRLRSEGVHFLTGTDEHGEKIEDAAKAAGKTPKEYADHFAAKFAQLWRQLAVTNDDFIRTTEPRHHAGVHALIALLEKNGDIYRGSYEGWYCSGCEAFYPESQLVEGKCPDQGHPVELLKEESYFFRCTFCNHQRRRAYEPGN